MSTNIFTELLRVLDASVGVQGRNTLLFADYCCLSTISIIYMEYKICVLPIKVHKCLPWRLDMARCSKISEFRSYTCVDKALATCGVSGSDKLCDLEDYSNTGEDKRETTWPWTSDEISWSTYCLQEC